MKKWLMAVIFASLLALAACGGGDSGDTEDPADTGTDTEQPADDDAAQDDTTTEDDSDEGDATVDAGAAEEIYKKSCASCHAADLSGGVGPDLTTTGADHSVDEIEDIINDGVGSMPGGLVAADEATVLAEWLGDMK